MKVIIAGSRHIDSMSILVETIKESGFEITEVVCGGASGVDKNGHDWAVANSIPVKMFNASWGKHGKRAGPLRNASMAEYADALIAVWDGHSRGTDNMIQAAIRKGLRTHVKAIVKASEHRPGETLHYCPKCTWLVPLLHKCEAVV